MRAPELLVDAARAVSRDASATSTWLGLSAENWTTIIAAIGAAAIAATVAVVGYSRQQKLARAERLATTFSEALRAVEDYLEAPYRIRRRDGSHQARMTITNHISEVQSRLKYYGALISLHANGDVVTAYEQYVSEARATAGPQMTTAWKEAPTRRDRQVPLGRAYPQPTATARDRVLKVMRHQLSG